MAPRKAAGSKQPRPKPRGNAKAKIKATAKAAGTPKTAGAPRGLPPRADLGFGDVAATGRTRGTDSRPRRTS